MDAKLKHLFKGTFQTKLRVYVERCMAYSEKQAWLVFCRRIAKKAGVSERIIMDYFQDKTKYKIELEIKFKEVEGDI